jgi:hypothetical protein
MVLSFLLLVLCPKEKLLTLKKKLLLNFKKELQTQTPLESLIHNLFRRRDKNYDGKLDQGELTSLLADYTMYEDMHATLAICSVRDWMTSEDLNEDQVLDVDEFYSQYGKTLYLCAHEKGCVHSSKQRGLCMFGNGSSIDTD